MKKFYSIIALASLMLTSVFSFSSCSKDDGDFNRATAQTTVQQTATQASDMYLYVAAGPEQLKYMDATYTVEVDGMKKVVKMSDMTAAPVIQGNKFTQLDSSFADANGGSCNPVFYSYSLGKAYTAKVLSVSYTALQAKADHEVDFITGYAFYTVTNDTGKLVGSHDAELWPGFTDVQTLAESLNNK